MRWRLAIALVVVAVLYVCHVHLKTAKIFANPTWDGHDDTGQFWSECAVHYRLAKFFATHPVRDWEALSRDRKIQYPDPTDDWAEFTIAMEVPVGVLYRWCQPAIPFHVWVVWYDCVVSSLTLFALFFLARSLWQSDFAGVMASVLYAGLYPSYGRTVKNLFLKEDFAIPLIVLAVFLSIRMLQDERVRYQVGAGLMWLVALASWHLTQFLLAVAVGAVVLVYLGKGETPRRPWLVLVLTAGALCVPVLRAKQFYISPMMCTVWALTLAAWIDGGRQKAALVFAGWLVAFLAVGAVMGKSLGEYAHVYELFFNKLRYLGEKPADPKALPWEARCLWESAFETARWSEWWHSLLWCGPLAIVGVWGVNRRSVERNVFVVFTLLLVPLSWMVLRYFTFLGWAAAVLAAGVATKRIGWKVVVVAAAVWQLATLNFQPLDRAPVVPADYKPVVQWINANTPPNAVMLASIAESPVLLAYTGRPIILQSKFENREIRERDREFLAAAYGNADALYNYCRKYGADYFVWDSGFLSATRKYKAGNVAAVPVWPDKSPHFRLEFSTPRFAVFRVLK